MTKFSTCKLEIDFEFGSCRNNYFSLHVDDGNSQTRVSKDDSSYSTDINLPAIVRLKFSGKTKHDTIIDKDNKIIEDMYVKILAIRLDKMELNEKFIHQKIEIVTDSNDTHTTSYIGYNGTMTLNLAESNVFSQVLTLNS
jgi:hypothetical protein